jgi:hypothetical protein
LAAPCSTAASEDDLCEVAELLNAAAPELFDAIERAGGSAMTTAFLDHPWNFSGGAVAPTSDPRGVRWIALRATLGTLAAIGAVALLLGR